VRILANRSNRIDARDFPEMSKGTDTAQPVVPGWQAVRAETVQEPPDSVWRIVMPDGEYLTDVTGREPPRIMRLDIMCALVMRARPDLGCVTAEPEGRHAVRWTVSPPDARQRSIVTARDARQDQVIAALEVVM
jgi:hypothetical protein